MNMAVFDSTGDYHGSKLIRSDSPIGKQIRELVRKAQGTDMRRITST